MLQIWPEGWGRDTGPENMDITANRNSSGAGEKSIYQVKVLITTYLIS